MTLRDVTRDAKVNLAAVNYHFGSKTNLMRAVVENRFEPINAERIARLDQQIAVAGGKPLPLKGIFDALFLPLFEAANHRGQKNVLLMQMIGRALTEPADFVRSMHREFFLELCQRFLKEIQRSCPQLTADAVQYRFFLAISTMIGAIGEQTRLENDSNGELSASDMDRMAQELVNFTVAGFLQQPLEDTVHS